MRSDCARLTSDRVALRLQRFVAALLFLGSLSWQAWGANPVQGNFHRYYYDSATPNTALRYGPWREDYQSACQALGEFLQAWFATFGDGTTRILISAQGLGYYCSMVFRFTPSCWGCNPYNSPQTGVLQTVPVEDRVRNNPKVCSPNGGNPIYPLTGSKRQVESLGFSLGPDTKVSVAFDSLRKVPSAGQELAFAGRAIPSFGNLWESNLHKSLALQRDSGSTLRAIHASRGAGQWISFTRQSGSSYAPSADVDDRITAIAGGWRYYDAAKSALETYDSLGQLNSVHYARGGALTYTYSTASSSIAPIAGLLISVEDSLGRTVGFEYESGSLGEPPRIARVTSSDGRAVAIAYDTAGNLQSLTWPDGQQRRFIYDEPGLPWALSGVTDEAGVRYSTYRYDAQGRAVSTELAGAVNAFTASQTAPAVWLTTETLLSDRLQRDHYLLPPTDPKLTDPLGQVIEFGTQVIHGTARMTSRSQPAGSGCSASSSAQTFDLSGNVASRDDFNGHRACYTHDQARNVELVRVEGLAGGVLCNGLTGAGAALPSGSRKVSTEWHPDWRLKTKVAEPSRLTTYVYHGRPDPLNGNVIASCPGAGVTLPTLPGGKPLALLCKQVEQATADLDGSQGLSAALQPGVPARERSWTYDEYGQVLTEKDPLNNVTSYAYWPTTTFTGSDPNAEAQTKGDLKEVTNAAGKKTQYTLYNRAGQVVEMKDGNNVITRTTYDARQRLLSASVGGQTTNYEYWPTGLLRKVTQADGVSWVEYTYDQAHRLKTVRDNRNNEITYELDNLGNRKEEKVKDPTGTLRRQLARDIDALGRVEQITGRE